MQEGFWFGYSWSLLVDGNYHKRSIWGKKWFCLEFDPVFVPDKIKDEVYEERKILEEKDKNEANVLPAVCWTTPLASIENLMVMIEATP